jgi:hypothetical protein
MMITLMLSPLGAISASYLMSWQLGSYSPSWFRQHHDPISFSPEQDHDAFENSTPTMMLEGPLGFLRDDTQ